MPISSKTLKNLLLIFFRHLSDLHQFISTVSFSSRVSFSFLFLFTIPRQLSIATNLCLINLPSISTMCKSLKEIYVVLDLVTISWTSTLFCWDGRFQSLFSELFQFHSSFFFSVFNRLSVIPLLFQLFRLQLLASEHCEHCLSR